MTAKRLQGEGSRFFPPNGRGRIRAAGMAAAVLLFVAVIGISSSSVAAKASVSNPDSSLRKAASHVDRPASRAEQVRREGQPVADQGHGRYRNPIISSNFSDPSVVRVGGDYYMTHSSNGAAPGLLVWHSRDLVSWEPLGPALKRYIGSGEKGIMLDDLLTAVREEFKENEDLPNTTNPDDWAKIAGKKGERIVYVKPLIGETKEKQRSVERVVNTGQYL